MFDMVADIEAYPKFVPWCREAIIRSRLGNAIEASLAIAKGPINLGFTTRNTLTPSERIDMALIEGPFRHFKGVWMFEPVAKGSLVTLQIEFEFASKILGKLLSPVLEEVAGAMVRAFCSRADDLHAT
ncbi:MAG: type II toxin-antitoxin system RatA family toxin [Gammaproteobacteria bacterium]|nr:type II toxin-antitoxin system RatA family toxin [Gammaproteobacteria bacterium]